MPTTQSITLAEAIEGATQGRKRSLCPAHDDETASLSVGPSTNQTRAHTARFLL